MPVRRAREPDLPAVFDSFERTAAEGKWIGSELPLDRTDRIARWRDFIAGTEGVMLVAEVDGEIVGGSSLQWIGHCGTGLLGLGMWLDAPYRGRGLGTALLTESITWAKDNGAHKITLEVWPHNDAALALYRRFGFEQEGYLRRHWRRRNGELWDSIVMGLLLE
jgi:RimJ/RimL family protein N-acetyltransferase